MRNVIGLCSAQVALVLIALASIAADGEDANRSKGSILTDPPGVTTPVTLPSAVSQPRKGVCNRGKGIYSCLLTDKPKFCPIGSQAILYRQATCAPCVAGSTRCPCAPALYECRKPSPVW